MSDRSLLWVPLGLALAAVALFLGPYPALAARLAPRRPLDEAPATSARELQHVVATLGEEGLALYRAHFVWDVAFLAANALVLFVLLRFALTRLDMAAPWRRALLALPLVPALLDLFENLALARLLAGEPRWLAAAAFATNAKLVGAALAGLAVFAAWSWLLAARFTGRGRRAATVPVSER